VNLHAAVGHTEAQLGADDLCHIAFVPGGNAGIGSRGKLIYEQLGHGMFGEAVGDHELHGLAIGKRRAERHALLGVADREVEAALGHTEAATGLIEPARRDP